MNKKITSSCCHPFSTNEKLSWSLFDRLRQICCRAAAHSEIYSFSLNPLDKGLVTTASEGFVMTYCLVHCAKSCPYLADLILLSLGKSAFNQAGNGLSSHSFTAAIKVVSSRALFSALRFIIYGSPFVALDAFSAFISYNFISSIPPPPPTTLLFCLL